MSAIWCTAGVSGIVAPAIAASRGLQTPHAITTCSTAISPSAVTTARIRGRPMGGRDTARPVTSVLSRTVSTPRACARSTHDGARAHRVDHRHARRVEAAQDHVAVHELRLRDDLGGREQFGLDAPGACRRHPPAQFFTAGLGARHLDPAAHCVDAERGILALALKGQHRDLAVVFGGKDKVRRVAGGAAGVG